MGGAPAILAAIPTDEVIVPHSGVASAIKKYAEKGEEKAAANAANYRVVTVGERFYVGGAEFLVLGPIAIKKADPSATAENVNSLITRVTYGSNTFLLTGDATGAEFKQVEEANPGCLRAQVFKNAHHNGTQTFAAQMCQPQITVFSTSKSAQPSSDFVSLLKGMGSQVYITSENKHGHVKIVSDGKNLSVTTQFNG